MVLETSNNDFVSIQLVSALTETNHDDEMLQITRVLYFDSSNNSYCWENCGGGTPTAYDIFKAVLVATTALLILLGNSFCLAVLWRTKDYNAVNRLFMTSLNVTDLLFGLLVVLPVTISSAYNRWPGAHEVTCRYHETVSSILGGAVILCLFGISVDRYLCVTRPLVYGCFVTHKRALAAILLLCSLPTVYRLTLPLVVVNYVVEYRSDSDMCWLSTDQAGHVVYTVGVVLFGLVPFVVTFFLYVRMFAIARGHARRIAAVTPSTSDQSRPNKSESTFSQANFKSALTFLIVTVTFAVCWLPFIGAWIYRAATHETINEYATLVLQLLCFSNSWLNCLVYYFHSTTFKRSARDMISAISDWFKTTLPQRNQTPVIHLTGTTRTVR